jgi:hypothetical protein
VISQKRLLHLIWEKVGKDSRQNASRAVQRERILYKKGPQIWGPFAIDVLWKNRQERQRIIGISFEST